MSIFVGTHSFSKIAKLCNAIQDTLKTPGSLLLTVLRQWFCLILALCYLIYSRCFRSISYSIGGYLLAHLSRRLIGETLSMTRHPTSVRPSTID